MIPEVYIIEVTSPIDADTFRFLLRAVSPEKQERILKQRIKQNADNMLVGAVLAGYMIQKIFGIPLKKQHVVYDPYGKPYLKNYPDVHFNISHSGKFVACAVCDQPVGIDIQTIEPYRLEVAQRVCTAEELSLLGNSNDPAVEFTKIWVQKEAYLKMRGIGIYGGIHTPVPLRISVQRFKNTLWGVACRK